MVKCNGPMFSLSASGKLAGSVVFASWKGRAYARSLVTPANPRSAGQTGVRAMFKWLAQNWAQMGTTLHAAWEERAAAQTISTFNAFMGFNQARWRNFLGPAAVPTDLEEGTNGVYAGGSATAGVRQITISKELTTANQNWGFIIHRALETGFDVAFSNAIAVVYTNALATYTYVDTPLIPDEYFYNFSSFTSDGLRELDDDEVSATVE